MRAMCLVFLAALGACGREGPLAVSTPAYAMPFCTRTLGVAECFAEPASLPDRPAPLGDMPVRVHRLAAPRWAVPDKG